MKSPRTSDMQDLAAAIGFLFLGTPIIAISAPQRNHMTVAHDLAPSVGASLPLAERLATARLWLLERRVPASKQIAMGADRWQSEPPAEQRMQAAVAAALRELADCVEQQGVQLGLAQALLLDQVPDQKAQ